MTHRITTQTRIDFEVALADQVYISDGLFWPATDNDVDLGDATHRFKDAWFFGHMGIGEDGAVSANRWLTIRDNTIDTDANIIGSDVRVTKTAGASDAADVIYGGVFSADLNQVGGTVGYIEGMQFLGILDAGTVNTAVIGAYESADLNGGTVNGSAYGAWTVVDQEAANTVSGNIYGHYIWVDADGTVTGTAYMLYLAEQSNVDYGVYQNGTAPNYFGGRVGVNVGAPAAMIHADQSSASGAIPVLALDQADDSEGFIDFLGNSAASAVGPISTWTAGNTIQGFVRVEINGAAFWMPYYDAPTS